MHAQVTGDDVPMRLDRLPITLLHLVIVGVCALGFSFDLFEIALSNALSAVFSTAPHHASSQQLSFLLASPYLGAVLGAPCSGYLADKIGRRKILFGLLLWLAVTSICGAAASTLLILIAFRGLSGIAIGGYWPVVVAYLTDLLPPRHRGSLIVVMAAIATLGPVCGIFLLRGLTALHPMGIEGWRWALLFGSVGAAATAASFLFLPESARWLKSSGYVTQGEIVCARLERSATVLRTLTGGSTTKCARKTRYGDELPAGWGRFRQQIVFGLLFFLSAWATVAFPVLSGAVLIKKGFNLSDTLLYLGLSFLGPFIAMLAVASVVDLITRRTALTFCAILLIVSGFVFCDADSRLGVIAAGLTFTTLCVFYINILNVYAGETFVTRSRAGGVSSGWAFNRAGAVIAPLFLTPVLHDVGATKMFFIVAATLAFSAALLLLAPRGRSGQPVR